MDVEKSFDIQRQIRNNASEFHQHARDLKLWEAEMKRKDKDLSENSPGKDIPPIRKKCKNEESKSKEEKFPIVSYDKPKRISSYDYSSWDKFDVDKACEELDESPDSEEDSDIEEEHLDRITDAVYNKELGNKLVKEGKWGEAIEKYNEAIKIYPLDAVFFANRALCFLKMKNYVSAEADCTSSIRLDNSYVKAYQRRAAARKSLNQYQEARNDILKVLELEPNNKQAEVDIQDLNRKLNISTVERRIPTTTTSAKSSTEIKKVKELVNSSTKQSSSKVQNKFSSTSGSGSNIQITTPSKPLDFSWVPSYDSTLYSQIEPVIKPPHQQSKKSMIQIDLTKDTNKSNLASDTKVIEEETKNILISDPIPLKSKIDHNTQNKEDDAEKKKRLEMLESAWKELQNANPYRKPEVPNITCDKQPSVTKPSDTCDRTTQPDIPPAPKTYSQFELHWRSLKPDSEKLYCYLNQISGVEIPDIFQEGLESHMLIEILTCLSTSFVNRQQPIGEFLLGLSKTRRLDTLVMFMTEEEKCLLRKLVDHCKTNKQISSEDLKGLKERFEL